jgi:hypothetical protein
MPRLALVAVVALVAGTAGAGDRAALDRAANRTAGARRRGDAARPRAEKARPSRRCRVEEPPTIASPSPNRRKPAARRAPTEGRRSGAPAPASVARERTEVLDALIALRREHDAVRAGTLLGALSLGAPARALREEALALAIEAADARGDRPGAAQLAQLYQQEFPAGRFFALRH